jgi:hypothetical protein
MSVYEHVLSKRVRKLTTQANETAAEMRANGYELLPVHLQRYITALNGSWVFAVTGLERKTNIHGRRARLVKERWIEISLLKAALVLERLEQEHLGLILRR